MSSELRRVVRLAECASFQEGYVNPSQAVPSYFGDEVKWLRATDLNNGFVFDTGRRLSKEGFQSAGKSATLFAPGTLAISKSGTIGRIGILQDYMCGNRAVINIKPNSTCDTRFIFYTLLLNRPQIETLAEGSVQKNLYVSTLGNLKIEIPSLAEQKAISSVLGALDDRITLLRETNATLEAIAQALFKSWFVDFDPVRAKMEGRAPEGMDEATAALFPDSFEESELGLVPRGWRVGTLADLAAFQNGYAFKSKDWVDSGNPVVKIGDVKPGFIDFSGCSFVTAETTAGLDRFRLNRGDLLVGMTGYVGETGLVAEVEPAAYLNQRVGRIATAEGMKDGGFVYCLVRKSEFKVYAEAQSHGSAQANVSGSALLNYSSVIPAVEVMSKFNDLIYPILETILSNHEQAQTLATLRDTLLPRLISGQLRLPEAQAVAEEALA